MQLDAVDLVSFPERADRVRYMASTFPNVIRGRVLDVGCDVRVLKQLRPDLDYVGIDIGGDPDLKIDLETIERLPFVDRDFDAVLCSEVLEHLDNLHHVFGELVRVSRKHVLISLPNCWTAARRPVARGSGAIGHYGLPTERPPDRHKWFFSLQEASEFASGMADAHGLSIVTMRASEKPRPGLVRALRRLSHPDRDRYLNLFAHTLWVLFERRAAHERA
ncbi:MAG: class I SAM-dependent methyltransferase [Planctomycetota bacterium]